MENKIIVKDADGKTYALCPMDNGCCADVAAKPVTQAIAQPVSTRTETIEDWAERIGYPHMDKKVRLITRLPKLQTYDSYDVSDVEEIMERWPNRQIIGAFDINGDFQKAPAYTNPRATTRFAVLN